MSNEPENRPENNTDDIVGSPRRRQKLIELMREEINFSEEAIVRFAKTRLQIDGDY